MDNQYAGGIDDGSTRVFRMPSNDVTAPDLMAGGDVFKPVLVIIKGPQVGATFELDEPVITIGRDPSSSIFLNDMTVSRRHARIVLDGSVATIEDLGSLNGIWVDGAAVNSAPLHDSCTIQIGTFVLVYHDTAPRGTVEVGD